MGKNRKNGGNLPTDKRFKNSINFIVFEFRDKKNNWFLWDTLKVINIKIITKWKYEYIIKCNIQSKLFTYIEDNIQP